MKIKFSILSALFCLLAVSSWADTTNDKLTLSTATLNRGGDLSEISVNFVAVDNMDLSVYSGVQMDIYLPAGYEFVQIENDDEMVFTVEGAACRSKHSTSPAIQKETGALRVLLTSSNSGTFKDTSTELFKFYVKAGPYAKPGYADVQIKDYFFATAAGKKFYSNDITIADKVSASESCTLPVSVSNTWSTFVSPCAAAIPEGVKAYRYKTLDTAENKVYLQEQSSFEAYVPYVLYSESAFSGTTKGTSTATEYESKVSADGTVTDGIYVGAVTKQSASAGYVLQNLTDGVKFYKIATGDEFTIPVGKCYLNPGSSTDSSKLSIAFEEADGINNVNANGEETIYDLSGRKLQNAQQRGIYIVNGKKVVK